LKILGPKQFTGGKDAGTLAIDPFGVGDWGRGCGSSYPDTRDCQAQIQCASYAHKPQKLDSWSGLLPLVFACDLTGGIQLAGDCASSIAWLVYDCRSGAWGFPLLAWLVHRLRTVEESTGSKQCLTWANASTFGSWLSQGPLVGAFSTGCGT